jgi:hypothetical protein
MSKGHEYVQARIVIEVPAETDNLSGAIVLPSDPVQWAEAMRESIEKHHDDPDSSGDVALVLEALPDGGGFTMLTLCPTSQKAMVNLLRNEPGDRNNLELCLSNSCAYKLGTALIALSKLNERVGE